MLIAFWMLSMALELTDAVFGTIVLFGEVVAITNHQSPAPDINDPSYGQVAIFVELLMYSTSLIYIYTYVRTV